MKATVLVPIAILAVASLLGWRNHRTLSEIHQRHEKLVATASARGLLPGPNRSRHRVRITRTVDLKLAAKEFIALSKDIAEFWVSGDFPTEDIARRIVDRLERILAMDAAQLELIIDEVRSSKDLPDDARDSLADLLLSAMASEHPRDLLALMNRSPELFSTSGILPQRTALQHWANDDPLAALRWFQNHSTRFPELLGDSAQSGLLSGTAIQNPRLAFRFIEELGIENSYNAMRAIVDVARTPEERTAMHTALREYLSSAPKPDDRSNTVNFGFRTLARNVAREGYDSGSKWLSATEFAPGELKSVAQGIADYARLGETGKWIEWFGANDPDNESDSTIHRLISKWTEKDYRTAGNWLAQAAESPAKHTAIRGYAETISPYDPETAAKWAMTLPASKERDQTLRTIYKEWPKNTADSKAAAEAFAKEHGIK